jgi:hypothetical protein
MTRTAPQRVQKAVQDKTGNFIGFKYYIHDTALGYSLEMSGPFTESSVPELACCWDTARTTLRGRVLTLDLRGVTSLDEKARQWLASMNQEGARYLPDSFLLDSMAGEPGRLIPEEPKQSFLSRLSSALRFALKPTL